MLHAENLFEVVSYFALYDLDALLLASRELCQHATKRVEKIPIWYFGSVDITFFEEMAMLKADSEPTVFIMGRRNIVDIIEIALRNSIIGHLQLYCNSQSTMIHSQMPVKSALIVNTLHLCTQDFSGAADLIEFLGRVWMIKAIRMYGRDNGMNFEPVVDFCRQRGVESVVNKFDGQTLL